MLSGTNLAVLLFLVCFYSCGKVSLASRNHLLAGLREVPPELRDPIHGIKMGVKSDACDNAKDLLETDWDGSPDAYTCYQPKYQLPTVQELPSAEDCVTLPQDYMPSHLCMKHPIEYNETIPTYGSHRPLWPVFGEYLYVPPQRWLHNIEHGAIVMLYHPCTEPLLVNKLRQIVQNCIRKHIITPYRKLPLDKPLALVAWGCKLLMNSVNEQEVVDFIRARALHGPEGKYSKEGQYNFKLLRKAIPPVGSDMTDSILCPDYAKSDFSMGIARRFHDRPRSVAAPDYL